jgi:hypothetical protein
MKNIVGPAVGAAIDRRDGDSGIKGAFVGSLVQSAARAAVNVAATLAVGWALKKVFSKGHSPAGGTPNE